MEQTQLPLPGEEPTPRAELAAAPRPSSQPAPGPARPPRPTAAEVRPSYVAAADEHQEDDPEGQLALLPGRRPRGTVPAEVWAELLDHAPTRERYRSRIWADPEGEGCWWWLGALSSTGHGKLRAGPGARTVVTAHVLGWQFHHGLIRPRPGEDPVVAHRCDEASCQRPSHWELIERTANSGDYRARRWRAEGPLADVRGAAGRAAAIRAAILAARAEGANALAIRAAIRTAQAEGIRTAPGLF